MNRGTAKDRATTRTARGGVPEHFLVFRDTAPRLHGRFVVVRWKTS
ncbi:hypothetical protein GZL_03676 [Streptomyces sp. 769]|nr:hypothetical protein GZL_03676 [Streptomyces sp. 769]